MKKLIPTVLMLAVGAISLLAAQPSSKPNIILILTDDVGLGDIGACGGPFKTPQIDALAKGGTRFEYCYSTPLCGPTRCQLLTGRYPFRTGLINNQSHNAVSPSREVMIPTVMKQAGYATASVGKWGQICLGPGEWGFDEYLVFQGSGRYWREQNPRYKVNGQEKVGDAVAVQDGGYVAGVAQTSAGTGPGFGSNFTFQDYRSHRTLTLQELSMNGSGPEPSRGRSVVTAHLRAPSRRTDARPTGCDESCVWPLR